MLNNHKNLSAQFCERISALRFSDVPPEIIDQATLLVVDTIGVMLAAGRLPEVHALTRRFSGWERDGAAKILFGGSNVSPPTAALVNGTAAHAWEFDDIHDEARIHASSAVLPAILAVAGAHGGMTAERFLTAYIVGLEVACRLGLACFRTVDHGWHPTTCLGSLAAAAAVGKTLDLEPKLMQHAIGIAFVQAGGTLQGNYDQGQTKRMGPGFAARAGVLSGYLARDGITGPLRFLEGDAGLFAVYERGEVRAERLLTALGSHWHMSEISIKLYPCCRCAHTVIDIGRELHLEGLRGDDLAHAQIGLGKTNRQIVGKRFDPPSPSGQHAQFNAAYCFARALDDGNVDLLTFEEERVHDVRIGEIARRIEVTQVPEIASDAVGPAHVSMMLKSGTSVTRRREAAEKPSGASLRKAIEPKFTSNMKFGLGADALSAAKAFESLLAVRYANEITAFETALAGLASAAGKVRC